MYIQIGSSLAGMVQRSVLDVLEESLHDRPLVMSAENEVRYKLIIDPSEDDSLVRLLFMFGVLERSNTFCAPLGPSPPLRGRPHPHGAGPAPTGPAPLPRGRTRPHGAILYMCSDFPSDGQSQKVSLFIDCEINFCKMYY